MAEQNLAMIDLQDKNVQLQRELEELREKYEGANETKGHGRSRDGRSQTCDSANSKTWRLCILQSTQVFGARSNGKIAGAQTGRH